MKLAVKTSPWASLSLLNRNKIWSSKFTLILSFQSQIGLILVQWLLSDVIPDHIPKGVFTRISDHEPKSQTDKIVEKVLGTFERWDAAYFLHIAQYGYTFENTIAFFPLFPLLVRVVAYFIHGASSSFLTLNYLSCFTFSAFLINVVCFSISTVVLYNLALKLSNNDFKFSSVVVLIFVFNPARVFFIAPYSESLYTCLTFLGLLSLYDKWNFKSCFFFALSALTRSNGLLNGGFLAHKCLCEIYKTHFLKRKKKIALTMLAWDLFCFYFAMGCIVVPFLYYQLYTRFLFCDPLNMKSFPMSIISHAKLNNYVLPGTSQASYCNSYELPYSFVQQYYWNVGFLRYFEFKQIPNFLMATPVLLLSFYSAYDYFVKCRKMELFFNLQVLKNRYYTGKQSSSSCLLSYYSHLFALSVFCFSCIHVQVSTRMLLSSSPLVYFIVAKYVTEKHHLANYCLLYFGLYCTFGLLAFTNYYPWT